MNRKLCAALLAAVMMISMGGAALAESPMYTPAPMMGNASTITVQGRAQVMADPDEVSVTANTSVTAQTVGGAQEEMNAIVETATGKLLALGVLDEDMVTVDYSYYPRYDYEANIITGYEANHTLKITCRDVDMLDSVISALTDSGVAQIYSVEYDVSTRSELYQQALELAIRRAEEKALRMAQTSGMTITGIESVTENGGYSEEYAVNTSADMSLLRSSAKGTGIRSGSVGVSAAVTVVYRAQQ